MSDRKTKRLSGFQYKQKKKQKTEEQRQLSGSLQKFLSVSVRGDDSEDVVAGTSASASGQCAVTTMEVRDNIDLPLLESSAQSKSEDIDEADVDMSLVIKCSEHPSTESIYSADPGKWP